MPDSRVVLVVLLAFRCIMAVAQDEGEVTFSVKQPAKPEVKATIISYKTNETKEDGSFSAGNNYKLYVLPDVMKFQFEFKPASKGYTAPELVFQPIRCEIIKGVYSLITIDSSIGEQQFKVSYLTPGRTCISPYNWLNAATGNKPRPFNYSVCTDTLASITVNGKNVACYKIESFYKTPYHMGMYREKVAAVYYIDKEKLLPVKLITEVQPIQIHMAIHFSAKERKAFKRKKVRIVEAQNWFQ